MSTSLPGRVLTLFAVVLLVLAGANILAERWRASADLTAERTASLSAETKRVLGELTERVHITAFFGRDEPGRAEAATLLARYRRENPRISWDVLDPALHPGEVRRLGIAVEGQAAVETIGDEQRIEIAPYTGEIDLTSATARLLRDVGATVCFSTGHGERDPGSGGPRGLSRAEDLLRDNGYELRTVDLLADPASLTACEAIVIAAPESTFGGAARSAVRGYLRDGGSAFVLADPDAAGNPEPLIEPWGIRLLSGRIVEGDAGSRLPGDPTAPIVSRYDAASPPMRGLGPTFFPGTLAVAAEPDPDRPGLDVAEVAVTSAEAVLIDEEGAPAREGQLGIAVAADDSEVIEGTDGIEIRRTRIFAVGDVDFASNAFIGEASNARLLIQVVDWLSQPEALVAAVPTFPRIRALALTDARSRYLLFLTAGVVPGLFLLAGGFVWAIRRRL